VECNPLKTKEIKFKSWFVGLVFMLVVIPVFWILLIKLEGGKPIVEIDPGFTAIGISQKLMITVSDTKTGIKKVWVGLLKDGKEHGLLQEKFPSGVLFKKRGVKEKSFNVLVEPKQMGLTDGPAVLRIAVWDYSWRGGLGGNRTYIEKEVTVDTKPPVINVMSRVHNISQGGSGLVIYSVSEPCRLNGVVVGDNFFPGMGGHFDDPNIYMAFIALSYRQGPGTKMFVRTVDTAGNRSKAGFPYYIRKKKFKKDIINISDRFLNWKVSEFDIDISQVSKTPLVDRFIKINRDVRKSSNMEIVDQTKKTESELMWKGVFLRLPKSARRASFADHRTYKYKGRTIDHQVHQGIDLASLAHSPVPVANSGKVVFTGPIGIYGRSVIIDHGFGLSSLYSHLNSIDVEVDQVVNKGEIIGQTGTTGLAGGDHLHFGMLVHQVFVNPVEWWDFSWITNNITKKIKSVESRRGEG